MSVMRKRVELGDTVIDPITEYEGIAYVRLQYLQGCDRIGIQGPMVKKEGEIPVVPEIFHVDDPQLNIVKRGENVRPNQIKLDEAGGPSFFGRDVKR